MLPMLTMEQEVMEAINGWSLSRQSASPLPPPSQTGTESRKAEDEREEEDEGEREKAQWRSFITIICGETGEDVEQD